MAEQVFPTKGNLINAKKTLGLCRLGYDLMDRKRNILIREMMSLIEKAKSLRGEIEDTYKTAYAALQEANITLGVIDQIAEAVPIENGISLVSHSVMGVELPQLTLEESQDKSLVPYGFLNTNSQLDHAYVSFRKVVQTTTVLAEVENSISRLATAIKKTQRRANALRNILIPRYEGIVKFITDNLEEKDREEFARMKVIKVQKRKKAEA